MSQGHRPTTDHPTPTPQPGQPTAAHPNPTRQRGDPTADHPTPTRQRGQPDAQLTNHPDTILQTGSELCDKLAGPTKSGLAEGPKWARQAFMLWVRIEVNAWKSSRPWLRRSCLSDPVQPTLEQRRAGVPTVGGLGTDPLSARCAFPLPRCPRPLRGVGRCRAVAHRLWRLGRRSWPESRRGRRRRGRTTRGRS